jgi:hypothetical protein
VPLQLDPPTAAVYVDGELQPGAGSGVLALRSDRSHVLFVKREGYRSQQIVLTSEKSGEGHRLVPDRVRVTLRPVQAQGRSLRIDVDDEGSAPPSDVDRP